jgi:DNA polymerase-3 subunit epsilon
MCTVELVRRLTSASRTCGWRPWPLIGASRRCPHDALDDALVLAQILKPALAGAHERKAWLPVRPVRRRSWPNGQITHDELRPLKTIAARLPCLFKTGSILLTVGLWCRAWVALSNEVAHTYEELIERILHAGLAYTDAVDQQTSLVICDESGPIRAWVPAGEMGIPLVTDADFMRLLDRVVGGTGIEVFTDATLSGDQFTSSRRAPPTSDYVGVDESRSQAGKHVTRRAPSSSANRIRLG